MAAWKSPAMKEPAAPVGARTFVPPLSPRLYWFSLAIVISSFCLILVRVLWYTGSLDWLLVSGLAAFVLGLCLTHTITERIDHTLNRLTNRSALAATPEQIYTFSRHLETQIVKYWSPIFGSIVAISIGAAFVAAFSIQQLSTRYLLLIAEMLGGYIAGCYLGRMACYGAVGSMLKARGIKLHVIFGHPDTVGGLKPLGDFYFYQAMIVAIPAIFLATWLLLIPLPVFEGRYDRWREPYVGLLALAIFIEVLAFVLPLWSFHRDMVRQKRLLLEEADRLSLRIAEIQAKLAEEGVDSEKQILKEALSAMTARYRTIEDLPEWPVDLRTRRLFGLNNLALLVPLIVQYTDLSKEWADFLRHILTSAGG
jgi:hypothetical protein